MNPALWAALGAGVALLLLLAGAALVATLSTRRSRSREDALAAALAELDVLRERVQHLDTELSASRDLASAVPETTDYVITTAGAQPAERDLAQVSERAVLSVTVGEPLVKVAAFAHGLRKALSPETRNRIAFEMRREVKRARKERRKAARRARVAPAPVEEEAA
jgi:hypothetical protein